MTLVVHPKLSATSAHSCQRFGEVQNDVVAVGYEWVADVSPEGHAMHEFAGLVVQLEMFHRISA